MGNIRATKNTTCVSMWMYEKMAKTKADTQINKIPLFDLKGKKSDFLELNKDVFNGKFSKGLLYQAINMYRANQRKGLASTKRRGEVRGGGKKPWRQKGTGRARVASIRNPVWRGGGIAFGPHPRDFSYSLPKKMKRLSFVSSLNAKLKSGQVLALLDETTLEAKTKNISALLKKLDITGRALFLVEKIDRNLALSSRNIKKLSVEELAKATAYNVLSHDSVILSKSAVLALNKRASK